MPLVGGWCEKTRNSYINYILNEKYQFNGKTWASGWEYIRSIINIP